MVSVMSRKTIASQLRYLNCSYNWLAENHVQAKPNTTCFDQLVQDSIATLKLGIDCWVFTLEQAQAVEKRFKQQDYYVEYFYEMNFEMYRIVRKRVAL